MSKYKLILEKIGIFKDRDFDLDDVTVFCGSNEVGKTTIIDGVINAMAESKKSEHLYRHILKSRYGENFVTKLKIVSNNEDIKKIDHDLAKDLLLVRASRLTLTMDGSWVSQVQDKLFSGGVNPRSIIDAIQRMEDERTKRVKSPLYDVKQLEDKISDERKELNRVKEEIDSHSQTLKEQAELKNSEDHLSDELGEIDIALKLKEQELKKFKAIDEREKIKSIQADISDKSKYGESIKKDHHLTEDGYQNIKRYENEIDNLNAQSDIHKDSLQDKNIKLTAIEEQLLEKNDQLEKLKSHHDIAKKTQNRLDIQISESKATVESKPVGLFIAGGILLLVGIGLFAGLAGVERYSGIVAALLGVALLIKAVMGQNKGSDSNFDLKVEIRTFNQEYEAEPRCPDTSYIDAKDFLEKLIGKYSLASNEVKTLQNKKEDVQQDLRRLKKQQSERSQQVMDQEAELRKLLPTGILASERYFKSLHNKKDLESKMVDLENKLIRSVTQYGVRNLGELSRHIEHKIIEINNDPVSEAALTQPEMKNLENTVNELKDRKEAVKGELSGVGRNLAEKNTVIKLDIGRLSKKQLINEKKIQTLETEKEKKRLEMDSLRLLKSIAEEIDSDAGQKFQALSEGINHYIEIILGSKREIVFDDLSDVGSIKCHDYYGEALGVDQLSSGTRDVFALSARLAFLEKVEPLGDVFLILDDPFVFMDRARQTNAFTAIKSFYEKLNLPILFFTKDEVTKNEFCEVFANAKEIGLTK